VGGFCQVAQIVGKEEHGGLFPALGQKLDARLLS
jgi:hypothetical protein